MKRFLVWSLIVLWTTLISSAIYFSYQKKISLVVSPSSPVVPTDQSALYTQPLPYYAETHVTFSKTTFLFPRIARVTMADFSSLPAVIADLVRRIGVDTTRAVVEKLSYDTGQSGYRVIFTQEGAYKDLRLKVSAAMSTNGWKQLSGGATDHMVMVEAANGLYRARFLGVVGSDQPNPNTSRIISLSATILTIP